MIKVKVVNKSKAAGSVHVKSRGDTATEGEDYVPVDELIEFKKGEREREINIKINDDSNVTNKNLGEIAGFLGHKLQLGFLHETLCPSLLLPHSSGGIS